MSDIDSVAKCAQSETPCSLPQESLFDMLSLSSGPMDQSLPPPHAHASLRTCVSSVASVSARKSHMDTPRRHVRLSLSIYPRQVIPRPPPTNHDPQPVMIPKKDVPLNPPRRLSITLPQPHNPDRRAAAPRTNNISCRIIDHVPQSHSRRRRWDRAAPGCFHSKEQRR